MAENRVMIDGVAPVNGAMPMSVANNAVNNPIYVTTGAPAGVQFYTYSLIEAAGVVASNNFLSLFNPIGSGKTVLVDRLVVAPWATAATAATRSMTTQRITAASAGTLVAAANIPKFSTTFTNSVLEIRTTNPTVTTTGIPVLGFPPAITSAGSGVSASGVVLPPQGTELQLLPGEGIVFNTAAGDVDQLWNINLAWEER
jgi:hypothetical protein